MQLTRLLALWAVTALFLPFDGCIANPRDVRQCEIRTYEGVNHELCRLTLHTNDALWRPYVVPGGSDQGNPTYWFPVDVFGPKPVETPSATRVVLRVVHINGINTVRDQARENLRQVMRRLIQTTTYFCSPVKGTLAYNRSRPDPLLGPANDLMEVVVQKYRENPDIPFAEYVRMIYLADTTVDSLGISNAVIHSVLTALDDWFRRANTWVDSDLRDIVAEIRPHLEDGERVLLVPHSQGNLFANMVMTSLAGAASDPKSLQQFGIASPAAQVLRGSYLSSVNDTVLSHLAQFSPVLPRTLPIPDNELAHSLDPRGHNLIDIYLNPNLPGLEVLRTAVTDVLRPMVDVNPGAMAHCLSHSTGTLTTYEYGGKGCSPFTNPPNPPFFETWMHVTSIDGAWLPDVAGPGDVSPFWMLRNLDRYATVFRLDGVWRIIAHDTAARDLLTTVDGAVCNSVHESYNLWAFVFDPR